MANDDTDGGDPVRIDDGIHPAASGHNGHVGRRRHSVRGAAEDPAALTVIREAGRFRIFRRGRRGLVLLATLAAGASAARAGAVPELAPGTRGYGLTVVAGTRIDTFGVEILGVELEMERGTILEMFIAAGRGLVEAHARGLVHRDFKPDNVLVGTDERPRIVDFGLARTRGSGDDSERGEAVPLVEEVSLPVIGCSSP